MRTTLDVDEQLLSALLARHPDLSAGQAVEQAIRGYLSAEATSRVRALAGRIRMDGGVLNPRRDDRRS